MYLEKNNLKILYHRLEIRITFNLIQNICICDNKETFSQQCDALPTITEIRYYIFSIRLFMKFNLNSGLINCFISLSTITLG